MNIGESRWTDAIDERLTKLRAEGLSASEVAAALGEGFTRCAVLGRLHRLEKARIQREGVVAVKVKVQKRAAAAKPARSPRSASARKPSRPHVASPSTAMVVPARFVVPRETLPALRGGDAPFPRASVFECPWIDGDPQQQPVTCCGQPVSRGAYCRDHAARAYA